MVAQLDEVAEPKEVPIVYLSKVRNRTLILTEVVKQNAARPKIKEAEVAQCSIEGLETTRSTSRSGMTLPNSRTSKRDEQRLLKCFVVVTKLWNAIKRDEQSLAAEKQAIQERETKIDRHSNVVMEDLSELADVGGNGVQGEEEYRTVLNKYATIAGKNLAVEARRSFRR